MTKNKGYKRFVRRTAAAAGESYQRMRERLAREVPAVEVRSEEDRRRGRMLADLALRAADGKPVVVPTMPPEVIELRRALSEAQRAAIDPGAPQPLRDRRDELAAEFERASADASRLAAS